MIISYSILMGKKSNSTWTRMSDVEEQPRCCRLAD